MAMGIWLCRKMHLVLDLFVCYLLESGVDRDHIVELSLDDCANERYRDSDVHVMGSNSSNPPEMSRCHTLANAT